MSFVMADFYKRFVDEELDSEGRLKSFKLDLPENFNFSYDVIDELAKNVPDKVAMQWVNEEGEEHIFTYKDLSEKSSQVANMMLAHGVKKGDNEKFERLDVPKDTLVYLGNIDELSQIMRSVAYEYQLMKEGHEEVTRCYMEIFLLKLARQLKCTDKKSCIITDRNSRFMQLRAYIYAMPEDIADVGSMAWDMGISRSSFQHMYKKMFGVSVMTDVISARMERASQLLATTNLSVREVAERCGYTNEYGFMKRFKMHFGKTPTEFRSML